MTTYADLEALLLPQFTELCESQRHTFVGAVGVNPQTGPAREEVPAEWDVRPCARDLVGQAKRWVVEQCAGWPSFTAHARESRRFGLAALLFHDEHDLVSPPARDPVSP